MYMSVTVAIFMVVILSSLTMRASYADNIQRSLEESIDYSVRLLQIDANRVLDSDNDMSKDNLMGSVSGISGLSDFKQDFLGYLTKNITTRVHRIDVSIYGADEVNGLLSVEVSAYFKYPSGVEDVVTSYKTVVLNKYKK